LRLPFLAFFAFVAAHDVKLSTEEDWIQFAQNDSLTPETRGWILDATVKGAIEDLLSQLPCGFPEYGIPPLAPYTNPSLDVRFDRPLFKALFRMVRFRFDGLERMEIKKLQVSYTFSKKVVFHFNFKELILTAYKMKTDALVDFMERLGFSVRYEGSGPMKFVLENFSIQGKFKYTMPILWGSIKIYNFECVLSLGGVSSDIGGILGEGSVNRMINDRIEYEIPAFVNGNQAEISRLIEQSVVPTVNEQLKGKKIWYLLSQAGNSSPKCVPTPAPWLALD